MEIKKVGKVTDALLKSLETLLPQLSTNSIPLHLTMLEKIISSDSTTLLIAEENASIVGCLALVAYRIPTGLKFWIEDVVVDQNHRGKGIGKQLTTEAIRLAKAAGAKHVHLTSNPKRKAAHALYKKMGFIERETTVFRYEN